MSTTGTTRILIHSNPLKGVPRGDTKQFNAACQKALRVHGQLLATLDPSITDGLRSNVHKAQFWAISTLYAHLLEDTRQVILSSDRLGDVKDPVVLEYLQLNPLRKPRLTNEERAQLIGALWTAKRVIEGTAKKHRTGHHPRGARKGAKPGQVGGAKARPSRSAA